MGSQQRAAVLKSPDWGDPSWELQDHQACCILQYEALLIMLGGLGTLARHMQFAAQLKPLTMSPSPRWWHWR